MGFVLRLPTIRVFAGVGYVFLASAAFASLPWFWQAPDSIKLISSGFAGVYALLGLGALVGMICPSLIQISQTGSAHTNSLMRCVLFLTPLPFVAAFSLVLFAESAGSIGELLELKGDFNGAQKCYQAMSVCHRFYLCQDKIIVAFDEATLGRICDRLQKAGAADRHYQIAENLAGLNSYYEPVLRDNCPELRGNNSSSQCRSDLVSAGWKLIAVPRLLRLLSDIPDEMALNEFEFASSLLQHRNSSARAMGKSFVAVDLRPVIRDFRPVPPESMFIPGSEFASLDSSSTEGLGEPNSEMHSLGPEGVSATCVEGVSPAGNVLTGEELSSRLGNIPMEKALSSFKFAELYYPGKQARHVREIFPGKVRPGAFLEPRSVRELIPEQLIIISTSEYADLERMGSSGI